MKTALPLLLLSLAVAGCDQQGGEPVMRTEIGSGEAEARATPTPSPTGDETEEATSGALDRLVDGVSDVIGGLGGGFVSDPRAQ